MTGTALAKKYGIAHSTTDYKLILEDESVSLVIISTRHDSHAELILECLNSGKDVFVEKPLAIKLSELDEIVKLHEARDQVVTVGFNRRFSPHSIKIKEIHESSIRRGGRSMKIGKKQGQWMNSQ